jgi:hypothetical protein
MILPANSSLRSRLGASHEPHVNSLLSGEGLLIACLAPPVIYIFIHGHAVHFVYLFLGFFIIRSAILVCKGLVIPTSKFTESHGKTSARLDAVRVSHVPHIRGIPAPRHGANRSEKSNGGRSVAAPAPTAIRSTDDPIMKTRRAILNKVSPEKLDDLIIKLVSTFQPISKEGEIAQDLGEFVGLVFASASRQPQYIGVFASLLAHIATRVKAGGLWEEILVKQARSHWGDVCLAPVENSQGWEALSSDDQADARTRHRMKQLAVAEFCGLLSAYELVPASHVLSWLETLMRTFDATISQAGSILKESSTEFAVEVVSRALRGLGASEAECIFTDLDQIRFSELCDKLFAMPLTSSRVKCLLQDLKELRESGWCKLPMWKQALLPGKRSSTS